MTDDFVRMWTSGLAHCHKRFQGKRPLYRHDPTGRNRRPSPRTASRSSTCSAENAYVIADSNHGFKMIGVGALVARELLGAAGTAGAVPVRPVRGGRAAPGKPFAVPLELISCGHRPVGVVGAGWIAREHRRVLESLADAELVAVCDTDLERAAVLAAGTGARTYRGLARDAWRRGTGAAVRLHPAPGSTGSPRSPPFAKGLPVYLEKPVAQTPDLRGVDRGGRRGPAAWSARSATSGTRSTCSARAARPARRASRSAC